MEEVPESRHADESSCTALLQTIFDLSDPKLIKINDAGSDGGSQPKVDDLRIGVIQRQNTKGNFVIREPMIFSTALI